MLDIQDQCREQDGELLQRTGTRSWICSTFIKKQAELASARSK